MIVKCFWGQAGWIARALLDWQLHLAQVDTFLYLESNDVDSPYDGGVVENENFWVRLYVEFQLFWAQYAVETLTSPWLNFFQHSSAHVVVYKVPFYLQKCDKGRVCSVKRGNLSCAREISLLEVKVTDVYH